MEWFSQTGAPMPGNVQGQVGWDSEPPAQVEDIPAHGQVGVDYLEVLFTANHSMVW